MRIKVELDQRSRNRAVIHFDELLPEDTKPKREGGLFSIFRNMEGEEWKQQEEEEPAEDELYGIIHGIHGVVDFSFEHYTMFIRKGTVFPWEEIIPRIITGTCYYFGDSHVDIPGENVGLVFGDPPLEYEEFVDEELEEIIQAELDEEMEASC